MPVPVATTRPVAVVSGYGPDVLWRDDHAGRGPDPRRAAVGGHQHRPDVPTATARRPGTACWWRRSASSAGVEPVVAGKPERPLLDETVRRVGGDRPLMVGDRLDTDIEGARTAGVDSLLVMTGVTGLADLVAARPRAAADVRRGRPGRPARAARGAGASTATACLGGWRRRVGRRAARVVDGDGRAPTDWWRVGGGRGLGHLDETGEPVDVRRPVPPPAVSVAGVPAAMTE